MKNVTLAIDDELLHKARALAEQRGSTLNAMIRGVLAREVAQSERLDRAKAGMRGLMEKAPLHLGSDFKFDRGEIYEERERRLLSRHQHTDLRGRGDPE